MPEKVSNSAIVKIIANHTREYNGLLKKHNTMLKVYQKICDDSVELKCVNSNLRKQNAALRKIIKSIGEKWEGI